MGNLFDVKQRAIENLHEAGIDVVLVVTVVNDVNNDQVGPILDFAIANADKITVVSFQPVSFTGRDEDITDADRERQRYTLSHLAHDIKEQTGVTEPLRDWFPLSAMGPFSDLADLLQDPTSNLGALNCGCHPNCGMGTVLFVNKRTKEFVPLSQFLDMDQLMRDVGDITDGAQPKAITLAQVGARAPQELQGRQGAARATASRISSSSSAARPARAERRSASTRATRTSSSGARSSSPACGSRISSTTTSAAPRCASSRTARRWARSASARTTPASAGETSSRR